MDRARATTGDDVDQLVTLLEGKGHRRPRGGVIGGTWPQQYRVSLATGGVMRGVRGHLRRTRGALAPMLSCALAAE
jgi:hypothetical protein